MDVLFAHAYFLARDPRERELMRPFPPLGLQYLVAYVSRQGFAADWWDSTFAPGPEAFAPVLDASRPSVVGFYGHTLTRPVTAGMVAQARARGCRVIAGGPDPAQYLDAYLGMGVEVVVLGEGEVTTAALLEHLRRNRGRWDRATLGEIDGIAFLDGERLVRTRPRALVRPIDSLPWPHRDRRDLDAYFEAWRARHGETALSLTSSRGCPYHCAWCSKQVYGDTFRRRDVDAVIDEMVFLLDRFAPDQLWFVDDMFTLNRKWVERFCARVVERGLSVPFYIIGRAETLDPALCDALKRAGCFRVYVSAESGADHVLDEMVKGTTVAEIEAAARNLRQSGIEMGAFVMLGYPGEARRDILATRDLLRRIDPEVTLLSVAHPMKGTAFYDRVAGQIVGERDGRLRFRMPLPERSYDLAQRMIWADIGRRREPGLRAQARYALWRGLFALA